MQPGPVRTEPSDAYGHELWDYYKTGEGVEVIERDDGYIDPSDTAPKVYFAAFNEWPAVEREGIGYAKGRVLDVGCGAGRVGIYLQRYKKLDVTGIDISPLAINVSRLRGLRKAKLLAFEDIDFKRDAFDSVVMFGNNFGLFGSMRKAKQLLKRLFAMTSADAVIVCESVDPYRTANPDHLNYQERNRKKGRMSGQVRIRARYRSFTGRWFDYLLVSPWEMRNIVKDTGWEVSRIIKSEDDPLYIGILRKRGAMIPQGSP
jgi:SAM-dependent methyltransferase